jgi:hypothetical protein
LLQRLENIVCDARVQLVAQRTADVEVSEEDMRKAFDKVRARRAVMMVAMIIMAIITAQKLSANMKVSPLCVSPPDLQLDIDRKGFISTNDIRLSFRKHSTLIASITSQCWSDP